MKNKKEYSNWIKEKIAQKINENKKTNNNKNEKSILKKNFSLLPNQENNLYKGMAVKNRKTNLHSSMDTKDKIQKSTLFNRKFTNINDKNSEFETFNLMKSKNNKVMSLSKSTKAYKSLKKSIGSQKLKNLQKNNNIAQSVNYDQNYSSRSSSNYKNKGINNNYKFIINNNYYNKNPNQLLAQSVQLFIGKENQTGKKKIKIRVILFF